MLRRRLGHRRDERTHHLRMSAERHESERRRDLADGEIGEEQSARRRDADARDHRARALLESGALEQSDDRKREPDDGDRTAVDERLAERGDDVEDRVAGGESGGDRRGRDDEQRIQSQGEADDDDENADEWKHARI